MEIDDIDNEINNFVSAASGHGIKKPVQDFNEAVIVNPYAQRREIDEANKAIFKETMMDWTDAVDAITTGDYKTNKVQVVKPKSTGTSNYKKGFQMVALDDDFCGEMTKALYPQLVIPKEAPIERNYEAELGRLMQLKRDRLNQEQMMAMNRTKKKIKSKNYHRRARKREVKQYLTNSTDKANGSDVEEKLDRLRAEQRISLKHRANSKFAKLKKLRAKFDENARTDIENMLSKGRELSRKREVGSDSEDDNSDASDEDANVKGDSDEDEENDDVDCIEEDGHFEMMAPEKGMMDVNAKHTTDSFIKVANSRTETSTKVVNLINTDQPMVFDNESDDELDNDREAFANAIYEVYQEDEELAKEFEREKAMLVEKEAPKDVDTFIPGWGDWTGPGCEKKDALRKQRGLIKAPKNDREDSKRERVFIRQGVHDDLKKILLKNIPYPYNTAEQFELSRKQLVSSAFVSENTSRDLIKPKYVTKPGVPIKPIQKSFKSNYKSDMTKRVEGYKKRALESIQK